MKKIINILILVALLVIIGLKLKGNKEIVKNRIYQYDKEQPIKVFAQKATQGKINYSQLFTGTFEANKEVKVNADVQGKITKYFVDEGAKVYKGQALVKLDASLLNIKLSEINVQIETLEKDLARYQVLAAADAIPALSAAAAATLSASALADSTTSVAFALAASAASPAAFFAASTAPDVLSFTASVTAPVAPDTASFVFSSQAVNNRVATTSESNVIFFILFPYVLDNALYSFLLI
ncbi:MAG TPA: biotin/lipoyl-binding protein [Flavobacteriaceae bacterium]|nr:biotin/lipoyl-binding protein [Flavobacteriaceae bacterium]